MKPRALVLDQAGGIVTPGVREIDDSMLPAGEVRVRVEYSSLNYKDAMVVRGLGKLVRAYPHVPGIDLAGVVESSSDPRWSAGDRVICTGFRVGELWWGGYAQKASLKGDWLVPMPAALDARRAMAIGTAGLAAMLGVMRIEENGVLPGAGDVLVTGATGGVGSIAVMLLAKLGHRVVASTGKAELTDRLRDLGAAEVVDRSAFAAASDRPLESERWAGCIDNVGGATLARVLAQMRQRGAVAAIGLTGGGELHTTVLPFLLRGVSLLGIDTNATAMDRRLVAWDRLVRVIDRGKLDAITAVEPLRRVPVLADEILAGKARGRVVIDVNA